MRQPVHCSCLSDHNCEMNVWWNWGLCTQPAICTYHTKRSQSPSVYESEDSVLRPVQDHISFQDVPVCITNLRSQCSLQMPKHTKSYAFCICTCIVYETEDSAESSDSYTELYAIPIWYTHVWIWGLKSSPQIPIQKLCLIQMHVKTLAIQATIDAPVHYPGCLQFFPCVPWCFSGSCCLQWLPQILERNITTIQTYMSVFMCCQPITM